MAFNVSYTFTAQDQFTAVAKKIDRATKAVRRNIRGMGQASQRARGKLLKFADSLKKTSSAGTGFGSFIAAATAGFGVAALTRKLTGFEDAAADLSAITGATGEALAFMTEQSILLGIESKKSATEVLTAFKLVASAKPDLLENAEALRDVTREVLLLSNASGIDLTTSALIVGQSLNQFSADAGEAARFVNVLAAGAKFGSSEIFQTGSALLKTGKQAKVAGLSFEKTNALLQVLAAGGQKAEIAGTGLATILVRMNLLGIDFRKLGLDEAFGKIKTALSKFTDVQERAEIITKAFGLEQGKIIETLLEGVGTLDDFEKKLTATNIAEEQATIRLATFSAAWRSFMVVIEVSLVKTLGPLLDNIKDMIDGVSEFVSLNPKIAGTALAFLALIAVLAPLGFIFSLFKTSLIPLVIKGFFGMAGAAGVLLSPIVLLTKVFSALKLIVLAAMGPTGLVIAGLALGAFFVIKNWEKVKAFFSGFFAGLTQALAPLDLLFRNAFGPIIDFIQPLITSISEFVSKLFALETSLMNIRDIGGAVGAAIGAIVTAPLRLIQTLTGPELPTAPTQQSSFNGNLDITLRAQDQQIERIERRTRGTPNFDMGVNMETSP